MGDMLMVWCGVVWCGVVWCGVVWCGVVWCGVCVCVCVSECARATIILLGSDGQCPMLLNMFWTKAKAVRHPSSKDRHGKRHR